MTRILQFPKNLTQEQVDELLEASRSLPDIAPEPEFLTDRQIEVCHRLDSMGQLHLIDEDLRERYMAGLRFWLIKKAGIPFKKEGE